MIRRFNKHLLKLSGFLVVASSFKLYLAKSVSAQNQYCGDDIGTFGIQSGINTAFGCIRIFDSNIAGSVSLSIFLSGFLRWAIGLGGGIAFLLIIYSGFMIMTSSGNPERLKAGQELLTSAIMGLIMLIFSIFILEIIGVDILAIPGFGN